MVQIIDFSGSWDRFGYRGKLSHQFLVSWSVEFWHSCLIFFNEFLESRPFKHVLWDLNNVPEGSVSFTFSCKKKNLERRHCTWSRILIFPAGGIWLAIGVNCPISFWSVGRLSFGTPV